MNNNNNNNYYYYNYHCETAAIENCKIAKWQKRNYSVYRPHIFITEIVMLFRYSESFFHSSIREEMAYANKALNVNKYSPVT